MSCVLSLQHVFALNVPVDPNYATMDDVHKSWLTEYLDRMGVLVSDESRCPAGQAVLSMYNLNPDNGQQVTFVANHVRRFNENCETAEALFYAKRREIIILKKSLAEDVTEADEHKADPPLGRTSGPAP
jgi:hypothetical protein